MENEFRIREEINLGRTQTTQQTTRGADTSSIGTRNITTIGVDKRGIAVSEQGAIQPVTDRTNDTGQIKRDSEFLHSERANEKIRHDDTGITNLEQDTRTGWEQERESLFATEVQTSTNRMDTDVVVATHDFSRLGGNLLQLAHSVEQLDNDVPVTPPPQMRVDKKAYKKIKEKKIAQGQKYDDHEQSQSYTGHSM